MADTIDYGNVDSFIPEIIAEMVLHKLRGRMNLARTVLRDYDVTPEKKGRIISIPGTGTITAHEKAANSTITLNAPDDTEVNVTLNQHWEVSWLTEDVARAFARGQVEDLYVEDAAIALSEKMEVALASLYGSAKNSVTGTANATYGTRTSKKDYTEARRHLVDERMAQDADMMLYLSTLTYEDCLKLPDWTDADKISGSRRLATGALGMLAGFSVFESNFVQSSGSPTTYHNLAYGKAAMILAVRPQATDADKYGGAKQKVFLDEGTGVAIRLTTSYSHDYLGPMMTLDVLYGVNTVRDEWLVDLQASGY